MRRKLKGRHWLVKSEPASFSFEDLIAAPEHTTGWDGVRNYQARNYLRDEMRAGDMVFFYHSSAQPTAIVGIGEIVREAYPDPTALDPCDPHHDARASRDDPIWYQVDIVARRRFVEVATLDELRELPALGGMVLLRRGSRLSVQPVDAAHWEVITKLWRSRPI